MKTKNITTAVFLDLSKAFDTLSHDKLLKKLHHCGIRGLSNDWFRNYLQNRKQYVSLEGTNSNLSAIQLGVPQGSILGPILFLIYINDIQHATTLNLLSYADDTTVYTSGATLRGIIPKLNEELGNLNQWFMANKLSLNINKTNYMIFTPGHLQHDGNTQIMINGHELTQAGKNRQLTSVKFLGLYIDENLTWRHHIDKIQTKLNSSIYAINSMKKFLPHYALRTIYQTLVESHLTYGIQLWGNSSHCDKLFKTQKRALRYIYKKPRISHTDPLFKKSKIMKLPDIYHVHTALFMHDIKNKRLPKGLCSLFKENNNNTRQHNNFYVDKPRTKFSSRLPKHQFVKLWNDLGLDLKKCKTRNSLKTALKKEILSKYDKEVKCKNKHCPDCTK